MSTLTWLTEWRHTLASWVVSRLNPAQWETFSLITNVDDMLCLQESLADCQHRRLVSMHRAFDDM